MALKVKMLTSANRDGQYLPNGSVQEFPDDEAKSLCLNGLASPDGWELSKPAEPESGEDGTLEDLAAEDAPAKPAKSKKAK